MSFFNRITNGDRRSDEERRKSTPKRRGDLDRRNATDRRMSLYDRLPEEQRNTVEIIIKHLERQVG